MLVLAEVLSVNVSIEGALKLVWKEEKQPFPKCTDHLNGEHSIYSYII